VTIKKVFFDANIFNDIFDDSRSAHNISKKAFSLAMHAKMKLYTSCDIATNIYYITAKYTTKENALNALEAVKKMANIIPFGEEELTATISLMRKDSDYKDFEDTIQYIMALNEKCEIIVTNDKHFVSKEIECMSSKAFVETFNEQDIF
jgi:predicted nucleic acid-binding protein